MQESLGTFYRRVAVLFVYAALAAMGFVLSFWLRFDEKAFINSLGMIHALILPVVIIKLACVWCFGLHKGMWRYAGVNDLLQVFKVATFGTLGILAWVVITRTTGVPRSIHLLYWNLTILLFGGIRFASRLVREAARKSMFAPDESSTLIVGAGDTGEAVLRALQRDSRRQHNVAGFLDDDSSKKNSTLHGLPILGTLDEAPRIITELNVETVIIATPGASKRILRRLVEECASHKKIRFQIAPAIMDLISGKLNLDRIRNVRVEDLLGRDPVHLDPGPVKDCISGKTILITGAGGSIGSELARQIAPGKPARLILLDIGETPLFEIDRELKEAYPGLNVIPVLCDIKNAAILDEVFAEHKPQLVYHAAAYKHVPLMESHPEKAVLNNIFGTRNLAEAAIRNGTAKLLMISTDKAVSPSSVMGASKRGAELLLQSLGGRGTEFIAVRFGNVLGSNGSVIPIFKKQIENGGPITVTHPDITRYFMTIPEAVELVLQASAVGQGGELFMLEMGEPVKIVDLAKNMIELSGMVVGEDIEIKFSGLRPGEKLYEELAYQHEEVTPTAVPKLLRHREATTVSPSLPAQLEELREAAEKRDDAAIRRLLWQTIALKSCPNAE